MKRFFYLGNDRLARFLTVHDQSMEMLNVKAVLGRVEKHASQKSMTAGEFRESIAMAPQHGFRELSEGEFAAAQASAEEVIGKATIELFEPSVQVLAWESLASDHRHYFQNNPDEYLSPELRQFCVYSEPVHRTDDIELGCDSLGATAQTGRRNLIFNKGLTTNGNFDAGDLASELPLFVRVKGDLHVHDLILTGWAELVVTGSVIATGTVFGYDGEAGGRLKVHGDLSAARILGGSMSSLQIDGRVNAFAFCLVPDEPSLPMHTKYAPSSRRLKEPIWHRTLCW